MEKDRREQILDILADVLERPEQERRRILDQRCGTDAQLRAEVEAMMAGWSRARDLFGAPVDPGRVLGDSDGADAPGLEGGDRIGPYCLVRVLGEGGMGKVWLAEQDAPIRRQVALKIIKLGMDTADVVRRFEAERQALALMDHPGIARVLDAGTTEQGRPFFVMELVDGLPINDFCNAERLSTEERLQLFVDVCRAVQHAHMKGVIHRDLKPSNILVSRQDGRPAPRVIDFGIAKAVSGDFVDRTLVTHLGQIVGTPAYMSPEQAEMSEAGVDTRTDVYALGVILYELLVGALPVDLRRVADDAIRAAIRDTDVPRPSTRLTSLGDGQTRVAADRRTSPEALKRELRNDLDWIVLKAMEKERDRRFDTASALAEDLERHLRSEPVAARPPSTGYRVRKFVRRHRVGVGAVAAAFALITASAATIAVQSTRIARERDKAVEVSAFLEDLFATPDPFAATAERRDTLRIRDFMDESAEKVRTELNDQPEVQAHMMHVLGRVYRNWGEFDASRPLLERSLEIRRRLNDAQHPDVVQSATELGLVLIDQGELDDAQVLLTEAAAVRRARYPDDVGPLSRTLLALGNVHMDRGEFDRAEALYREAGELLEDAYGPDDRRVAHGLSSLGTALVRKGEFDEAEPVFRNALRINQSQLGEDHPNTISNMNNLAYLLEDTGRPEEAERLHRRALELSRARFGEVHPTVARSLNNLANAVLSQGDNEGAEPLFRESLEMRREIYGEDHPAVGVAYSNLAAVLDRLDRLEESEAMYGQATRILTDALGPDHPAVATASGNLASLIHKRGDHLQALDLYETAIRIRRDRLPEGHFLTASVLSDYGRCLGEVERFPEGETALLEAYRTLDAGQERQPRRWTTVLERLAALYQAWGRPDEAGRYRGMAEGAATP